MKGEGETKKKLYDSGPISDELPESIEFFPGLLGYFVTIEIGKCRHSIPLRFFDKIRGYKYAIAYYKPSREISGIWLLYKLEDITGIGLKVEIIK